MGRTSQAEHQLGLLAAARRADKARRDENYRIARMRARWQRQREAWLEKMKNT